MRRTLLPPFFNGPADANHPDWCTEDGARKLAARIEAVWHGYGHTDVKAWVERQSLSRKPGLKGEATVPAVRTNLINGLPPSFNG